MSESKTPLCKIDWYNKDTVYQGIYRVLNTENCLPDPCEIMILPPLPIPKEAHERVYGLCWRDKKEIWFRMQPPDYIEFAHELLHLIEGKEVELEAFNSLYWILYRYVCRHCCFIYYFFLSILCIGFFQLVGSRLSIYSLQPFNSLYWILNLILDVSFLILDSCFYKYGGVYKLYSWCSWGSDQKRSWEAIMRNPWFSGMIFLVSVLYFLVLFMCYCLYFSF